MKPILFNTEMVRAILDGRKTQTRRIAAEKIILDKEWGLDREPYFKNGKWYYDKQTAVDDSKCYEMKPKYQPGDILWVRETWRDRWGMAYANYGTGNAYPIDDVREIEYKAGGNGFFMHGCNLCPDEPTVKWGEWSKWRPSIYMPREAARIFLRVTNVRVERLHDITENDARNEGVKDPYDYQEPSYYNQPHVRGMEINKSAFAGLWDSLNAKRGYGWDTNPWVWVYEFERVSEDGKD